MILRNVTIAEIEISESPACPAGERLGTRGNEPAPAPLAASTTPGDAEAPGAAEEARPSVTGPGTSAAILPTVLDESTVAALVAKVGDRVREAVENPPPPVEQPVELALKQPTDDDDLQIPAFLRRVS